MKWTYLCLHAHQIIVIAGNNTQHFSQANCQSIQLKNRHRLRFSREECGSTTRWDSHVLQYNADLQIWLENVSSVVHGEWKRISIKCSVVTSATVNDSSSVPELPMANTSLPDSRK